MNGFGVEVEITNELPGGKSVHSERLLELVKGIGLKSPLHEVYRNGMCPRTHGEQWEVKGDCSVGHEVVTPILSFDRKGFLEFHDFAKKFEKTLCDYFGVTADQFITPKGGIHVHFSKDMFDPQHLNTLFRMFIQFENTIYNFFPRFRKTARHNMPIRDEFNNRIRYYMEDNRCGHKDVEEAHKVKCVFDNDHGWIINLSHAHPTVEIRHSHTTIETEKSTGWVKFLFLMVHMAKEHPEFRIQFVKNTYDRFVVDSSHDKLENLLEVLQMKRIPERWLENARPDILQWAQDRTQEHRMAA